MRALLTVVAAALAAGLVACGEDGSPVGPTPVATSVTATGPGQVTPGTTVQFTALAQFSDGSTKDVTSSVSWTSTSPSVLRHTSAGRFDALIPGETRVTARYGNRGSSSRAVLVLPSGTFKLSGTVRDASGAVDGALVQVLSGIGAGKGATTASNGTYAFYGVAGTVELRVTRSGYAEQQMTIPVDDHAIRDVILDTASPTIDISGTWTLDVSTSSPCSADWPETRRRREVTASITQQGTRLSVLFNGPTVVSSASSSGRMAGNAFSLTIYFDDYYLDYGLLERLSPTDWVGIYGTAEGTGTDAVITGTFNGKFDYYVTVESARFLTGVPSACPADSTFTLRRQ